ncbi:MAG: hypothetical protein HQL37_09075 [Alphaproteobacteria bacterium]|nr:hypothetical protein [Alphaproteobacteria bacterium]
MGRCPGIGKTTCEACHAIDVALWHRQNRLYPGSSFTWVWSFGDKIVASIGVQVQAAAVVLNYRSRTRAGDWQPVEQRISLTHTACHFGGERPWFLCPDCRDRAGKLYLAGNSGFACRRCHDLTYTTRQETPIYRGLSRANRLRTKLGGLPGMAHPIASKPKGMHHATYARMVEMIQRLEATAEKRALAFF